MGYVLSEETITKIKQAAHDNFNKDHIHPGYYAGTVKQKLESGGSSKREISPERITTRELFKLFKQQIMKSYCQQLYDPAEKAFGFRAIHTLNSFRRLSSEINGSQTAVGIMWDLAALEKAAELISRHWPEIGKQIQDNIDIERNPSGQKLNEVFVDRLPERISLASQTFSNISSFFGALHQEIENAPDSDSAPIAFPIYDRTVKWKADMTLEQCRATIAPDRDEARKGYLNLFAELQKDFAERAERTGALALAVEQEAAANVDYKQRLAAIKMSAKPQNRLLPQARHLARY